MSVSSYLDERLNFNQAACLSHFDRYNLSQEKLFFGKESTEVLLVF